MAERELKVARNLKRVDKLLGDMDVGNRDRVDTEKGNGDSTNYHSFANLLMGMIPDCKGDLVTPAPLISMVNDSFGPAPALWDHLANPQSMGFNSINDHSAFDKLGLTRVSPGFEAPWEPISQFPADSAFIERAARFSCFSTGNITDMVNSFGVNQIEMVNPASASRVASLSKNGGLVEDTKQAGSDTVNSGGQEETSLIDTGAQPSSAKRISTKRKRGVQDTEQPRQPLPNSEAPPSNNANNGENGKQSSQTSDPPKEEYIHVRARRGQATNSHSLAERVRREKISDRMKFLQDLVPGCSKVTGKAVMLDEIINYVQSLQRQVEFLSMKLATVNPRLDFNIESLLAKDQMFAARVVPPILGFSADMQVGYPQLHPCQPNHPIISSRLTSIREGYKEPTSLVHSLWDDELHNVVQMGFNSSTSPENQDANSLPKVEL